MDVTRKLVVIGLLLLATLATGFWRGNAGNQVLPGLVHKLLAVAWAILTGILVYHSARQVESRAAFYAAVAVLAVSIVALFWTGSLQITPHHESATSLTVHRIATVFAVFASAMVARIILLSKP
jgi:D-alanyl-lipoteichoic acid acyltransferase DltB (MBOAT superfamily)